jgi:hypothetical protein
MRALPAPTSVIRYDLDMMRASAEAPWDRWPTLRHILEYATEHPDAELYDDAESAEEFAATLERWQQAVRAPGELVITVTEAQQLHAAAMAHLAYALENNYDAEAEAIEDPDAYRFAQFGPILLPAMAHPWESPTIPADGTCNFTLV